MIIQRLTKEDIDKWVAALRSGKYEQGKGILKDKNKCTYCCLGVLAEELDLFRQGLAYSGAIFLSEEYIPTHLQKKYAMLNDARKLSFNQIADEIALDYANYKVLT